jgi:two-component system, response regulator YesN
VQNYKLILVDDEEEVRKGVLNKIEWNKYGFQVVGEAENGKEALDIAEKTYPDVVITDIKMPFMDGMELAKSIRERFPTTKVIVLTGFDEFEYAQKAIQLNVTEYVLKPISAKELVDVLIKVKIQIDKEIAEKENVEYLREYYRRSIPILKEKFLVSLITDFIEKDEIEERAQSYGIDLEGTAFAAALVNIDDFNKSNLNEGQEINIIKNQYKDINEERQLMNVAVLKIVEEIIQKHNLGYSLFHNNRIVIIARCKAENRDEAVNTVFGALEELRQIIEKFLKLTVTIGLGSIGVDITSINQSYKNGIDAVEYRILIGNNRIIWIEDIEPESRKRISFGENKEHALMSAIKIGTAEEIYETIENLFNEISETKASFKDYQIYLMEMLTTILKAARGANVDIDSIFGASQNIFGEFYSFGSLEEIQNWFKNISVKIMNHIVKDRQDSSKLLVEKAKDYVNERYSDSDITINKVCDYLHISSTYFSFIFKREMKTTFINYLTQVRMEVAKGLLRNTSMKTFEIAEKVGYSESNYFSYSFKKRFGISPSEYRNSNTGV